MNNSKSFEEKLQRIEQIVRILEKGDVPLDESLKLFQEGTELVRNCGTLLDEAQLQVTKILPDTDGAPREEVFDHDDV